VQALRIVSKRILEQTAGPCRYRYILADITAFHTDKLAFHADIFFKKVNVKKGLAIDANPKTYMSKNVRNLTRPGPRDLGFRSRQAGL
jgi:hypothetical protein